MCIHVLLGLSHPQGCSLLKIQLKLYIVLFIHYSLQQCCYNYVYVMKEHIIITSNLVAQVTHNLNKHSFEITLYIFSVDILRVRIMDLV